MATTAAPAGVRRSVRILGVRIDDVTEDEAVLFADALIRAGGRHQVVTVNPEFVIEAQRNPVFAAALEDADLATPDGVGLLLAARYLGAPLRGRVTGVELTHRLAALSAQRGYRLFLLGAAPGVAQAAALALQRRYPGLIIAGTFDGSPDPRHEPFLRQLIVAAQPHILLVAYGHPRQDIWIARNQPYLNVPLAIGVGGVFDYLSGRVPRAPAWMRRAGLEWFYRLLQQPQRWPRIVDAVPRFAWAVVTRGRRG
ncbi:MAG: WecB/TagA/CpsF family glycosyltransferase [Oscillochloridaceae bacterium]|nr:WecB/TagA/CpsF family glycosyltransferase [Chloroflexaceae bacterium]MDW8388495.1 WecB/TagA/CpsF family glycosyltransferase [Oscillochloridaceae bacterium]